MHPYGAVEFFPPNSADFKAVIRVHIYSLSSSAFLEIAPKFQLGTGFISVLIVCPVELFRPDQSQLALSHSTLLFAFLLPGYSKVESLVQ